MKFNLTFNEAMEYLFKNKDNKAWVQGENFRKSYCLICRDNVIQIISIHETLNFPMSTENVLLTKGLMEQKYRIIEVLNYKNLEGGRFN